MKKWTTRNGYEIYHVLRGGCNCFLIRKDDIDILVDTGSSKYFSRLQKNLRSLKLQPGKLDYLILTHTHYDHCQNAARIKEQENCQIIISEFDKDSTEKGYTIIPAGTFKITELLSRAGKYIGKRMFGYPPFKADILINDSLDLTEKGLHIKLIRTAGHSIGSISVIVDDEIAITGDEMIGIFENSVFPPFTDDINEMIDSWGKLLKTDCEVFLPGHGREIKRELLQKEYDKYSKRHNTQSKNNDKY
jgi:hydroxyacylglutathione hydrolase